MRLLDFQRRQFAADLRWHLAEHAKRKEANAAARARCMAHEGLRATLQTDAERRGQREIDWVDYFRQIDINYP